MFMYSNKISELFKLTPKCYTTRVATFGNTGYKLRW